MRRKDDLDYLCDDILTALSDNEIDLIESPRPERDLRLVLLNVLPKHLDLPHDYTGE